MAWLPHINSGTNRRSRAGGNLEPGAGFSQPTGKISRTSASIRRSREGGNLEQWAILSHPRNLAGLLVTFFALVAIAALSGCAAAAPAPTATPEPTAVPATEVPQQAPTAESLVAPAGNPFAGGDEINPILATTILNPGEQRVSFLLVGKKAIIKAPEAVITATFQGQGEAPTQEATAIYHDWPFGIRGAYSARMTFDRPGPWQLRVSVDDGEVSGETVIDLKVVEESPVPAIGQRPPLSQTKTLADVAGVEQLTTDYNADEDLYQLTVAQAVESPRPAVVVFASPAFCTSATCGPQVDTVKELKNAFADRADFVHVEIYDQPEEIQGDLSKARFAPAVDEWGFSSVPHWFNESWVYILDEQGLADHRFEGFVTLTELKTALKETLGET